jgi:hypothetical protein
MDACIQAGGTLTIGYGNSGAPPLRFSLDKKLDRDVSYLKVFLANQNADLSMIKQSSPFRDLRSGESAVGSVCRSQYWDTMLVKIIQTRDQ